MKKIIPALLVIIIGIIIAFTMIVKDKPLKIFNPSDLNPKLVDKDFQYIDKNYCVGSFHLIDQNGDSVTNHTFDHKIYVTDFFFVTCPTICPKMATQMSRVYQEFKDNDQVMFLSHTVMPEADSVPVLHQYAQKLRADANKWKFVTGDKKQIYNLARKTYFAAVSEGDGGPDDFVHTENFVLVDKNKRLRGFYDGTSEKDADRLISDIYTLLKEYN